MTTDRSLSKTADRWIECSRRRLLQFGTAAIAGGFAGCQDSQDETTTTTSTNASESDVVESLEFDLQHLVVRLREGHDVSKINLLAPDGSLYTDATVAAGVTTVRLQILDVEPMLGGSSHYLPGMHELVLVSSDGSESVEVQLSPDLKISDLRLSRRRKYSIDPGRLDVIIENHGTGPTWISDIAYSNAPNFAANQELAEAGVIRFEEIREVSELVIPPGGRHEFTSPSAPFYFFDGEGPDCRDNTFKMDVKVRVGTGNKLVKQVQGALTEGKNSSGPSGRYTCQNIDFKPVSEVEDA